LLDNILGPILQWLFCSKFKPKLCCTHCKQVLPGMDKNII